MQPEYVKNFWLLGKPGLFNMEVAVMDMEENYLERVLERHGVHARFSPEGLRCMENDCCIRLLKVRRREKNAFFEAMQDLERTVLVCGHPEYLGNCAAVEAMMMRLAVAERLGVSPEDINIRPAVENPEEAA